MNAPALCVVCTCEEKHDLASAFSNQHHLPLLDNKSAGFDLQLIFGKSHIELFDTMLNTAVHVDFVEGALAHRQHFGGGRGQAIAKAIGLKQNRTPNVLDVTAGLARDAWVLASLGCRITLVERSPVLAVLINDAISRALEHETTHEFLVNNFKLVQQDAVPYLQRLAEAERPDVIYIDPMYPARTKSALVKKDMQILQRLIGEDDNAESILCTALECAQKRVVIKRPIHAPQVPGKKPSMEITGKKTRFDVYVLS